MEPVTVAVTVVATWLVKDSAKKVYDENVKRLHHRMGLVPESTHELRSILDDYMGKLDKDLKQIKERLDEDRLAKLYGGFEQLKDASKTKAKDDFLKHALNNFYTIASIPPGKSTGSFSNNQLRSLAFLGMASAHFLLEDKDTVVAEKLVAAVDADAVTARSFLGTDNTCRILERLERKLLVDQVRTVESLGLSSSALKDLLRQGGEGPEMVVIPAGSFLMGTLVQMTIERRLARARWRPSRARWRSSNEPQHEVIIAKPFAIGKYPVTFEEYDRFAQAMNRRLPQDHRWGRGHRPVINVSWDDAVTYCQWLSKQTGKRYRLPTEAEWEYAARAGTETKYWWGNEIGKNRANCKGCGSQWDNTKTAPVGSFEPNPLGLYDTSGNVEEWVQDCWHDNYEGAPTDGSAWESGNCDKRVLRGGSWNNFLNMIYSTYRIGCEPKNGFIKVGYVDVGFRIARDL